MILIRSFHKIIVLTIIVSLLIVAAPLSAQETTAIVPDVTGLSVPQAAALLNQNGLRLGAQTNEQWDASSGLEPNTISAQTLAPGQSVEWGASVDVTVLRSPNVRLVYTHEVISLVNQTGAPLDISGIEFSTLDGSTPAAFAARDWASTLDVGNCVQLWSVGRTAPDRPDGCEGVQRWLSTINAAKHFWTATNGVSQFRVTQNGIERAVCEAAPDGGLRECAFYAPADSASGDATAYIYLAYTVDSLIVWNQSAAQWMPVGNTAILNNNPNLAMSGLEVPVGDPELFGSPDALGMIDQLAPGQCLLFTNSSPEAGTPRDCEVIARLDIGPDLIFWAADFEIVSTTTGQPHTCLAAAVGRLTLCVMPR